MKKKIILGATFITLLSTQVISAYTHELTKPWSSSYQSATYRMQNTFSSETKQQFVEAISHLNSKLSKKFLYKSSSDTTATDYSRNDGMKTVTKKSYGKTGYLGRHIGHLDPSGNYVIDSDLVINTYYPFSNSGKPGTYDIKSVFVHEMAHALRVGHSKNSNDVMYDSSTMGSTKGRTLTSNDISALRASTKRWFK